MAKAGYYEAKESGVSTVGDEQISFRKGELFHGSHPLLKGRTKFRDELFKPAESLGRGDVEQATAAPGEKRGEKKKEKK
jgi:hypothetical protein